MPALQLHSQENRVNEISITKNVVSDDFSVSSVVKKKRRKGDARQNLRSEILSYHSFRVDRLLILLL